MDALQSDIEALEGEKTELKERLRTLSKKQLLEGLAKHGSTTSMGQSSGGTTGLAIKDSPMLLEQVCVIYSTVQCYYLQQNQLAIHTHLHQSAL